jgi:hypothetical protein
MNDVLFCSILYAGEFVLETLFLQNNDLKNVKFLKNDITLNDIDDKKVIVMIVRETTDCAAFICDKYKSTDIGSFLDNSREIIELKNSYVILKQIYKKYKEKCVIIKYEDIINNTLSVLNQIHKLLDVSSFYYDVNFVKYTPNVDSKYILGEFFDDCDQETFWDVDIQNKKPVKDLELQLKYALVGDFENAKKLVEKLEIEQPSNHRAAFNRGWFKMRDGTLLEGQKLLDRGRFVNVFGNPNIINRRIWNKTCNNDRVLFFMEGGLGDQIHAFRYVSVVKKMCKSLIVVCEKSLVELFSKEQLDVEIITFEKLKYRTDYDSWIPSMSVITVLEYEYDDILGRSYISADPVVNSKKVVGLKWSGNPKFEHQQYRKFPLSAFFNSVYNENYDYISLQRDEESDACPSWVNKVDLTTWTDTKNAINRCDFVISSCTSVAHLSGAMGKLTYIIIPILPYYLWALPGETTPYYDSVRLIRQTESNNWDSVFKKIKSVIHEH